ncbi:MAG: HAD hydrolase-like protein [Deltaproteobacteria bacterium]|nr:HAD hydrolase-like protein [Deltaproteobacteria bacterium]
MISTVLFDLDGTLTDPGEGIVKSIQAALHEVGLPSAAEPRLRGCVGPPLRTSFAELGARPDQIEPLVQAYRARYRDVGMFENAVYPGVPELLAELRLRECRLFVTTSKPTPFAVAILEHFQLHHFFEEIFGSKLDGSLSEKVDLLSYVRRQVGFTPTSSALVGDRKFDITAARTLGILAIGALWGYGRAELVEAGAERLAESPGRVLESFAVRQVSGPTA